ncbi:MAG: hypothetical protein V6Z82_07035 [Flavobacteriales bacterium]
MWDFLKKRLSEPSTYVAIGAAALGLPPEVAPLLMGDVNAGLLPILAGAVMAEKGK